MQPIRYADRPQKQMSMRLPVERTMSDFTSYSIRKADAEKADQVFGNSVKKADRFGVLLRAFDQLDPMRKFELLCGKPIPSDQVANAALAS